MSQMLLWATVACLLAVVQAFPAGSTQPEQVHLSYLGNNTMTVKDCSIAESHAALQVTWVTQSPVQKVCHRACVSQPSLAGV
jgi:hypothetical protein